MFITYGFLDMQTHLPLKGIWVSIASFLPQLRVVQGNRPGKAARTSKGGNWSTKPQMAKPRPVSGSQVHIFKLQLIINLLIQSYHTFLVIYQILSSRPLLSDVGRWNLATLLHPPHMSCSQLSCCLLRTHWILHLLLYPLTSAPISWFVC